MPTITLNKKARHDYEILETLEAGLVLLGHEVKSIKTGHISIKGAFVRKKSAKNTLTEFFLVSSHIPLYKKAGNIDGHNPDRDRKILLHKKQIEHLIGKMQEKGLTLVPLKVYTKQSLIKIEIGLARGKRKVDKRESIKKKDIARRTRTLTMKRR